MINARASVSTEVAVRLEQWVGGPTAETWLGLQANYDFWQLRHSRQISRLAKAQALVSVREAVAINEIAQVRWMPTSDSSNIAHSKSLGAFRMTEVTAASWHRNPCRMLQSFASPQSRLTTAAVNAPMLGLLGVPNGTHLLDAPKASLKKGRASVLSPF